MLFWQSLNHDQRQINWQAFYATPTPQQWRLCHKQVVNNMPRQLAGRPTRWANAPLLCTESERDITTMPTFGRSDVWHRQWPTLLSRPNGALGPRNGLVMMAAILATDRGWMSPFDRIYQVDNYESRKATIQYISIIGIWLMLRIFLSWNLSIMQAFEA